MYEIKWLQFCQSTILTEEVKYINPSALYSDSLKPLSVLRTGLKLGWQPIFSKKVYKSFLMQLFSAVARIFLLIFLFFSPQKVKKKHPKKLHRNTQIYLFSLTAWASQTAKTKGFMFQNVAYKPTVYRTGTWILSFQISSHFGFQDNNFHQSFKRCLDLCVRLDALY